MSVAKVNFSALLSIIFCWQAVVWAQVPLQGEPSLVSQAWYFEKIGITRAWEIVESTPDIKIAVIDMDFDLNHPELSSAFNVRESRDFSGKNFAEMTDDALRVQHGTLVSALIGADGTNRIGISGVSRRAELIALNIAPVGDAIDIAQVIRYAVDSGAKVINCSFGIGSTIPEETLNRLRAAIAYAREKDVLIVASAGNHGDNTDEKPLYPAALTAEFDNVISVGASTRQDQRFAHSNYGHRTVDFFAPGHEIIVPVSRDGFLLTSGTSEASPITAGVAALVRQVNPRLSAAQVKEILKTTVDPIRQMQATSIAGGRLNAYKAIKEARSRLR